MRTRTLTSSILLLRVQPSLAEHWSSYRKQTQSELTPLWCSPIQRLPQPLTPPNLMWVAVGDTSEASHKEEGGGCRGLDRPAPSATNTPAKGSQVLTVKSPQ